MSQVCKKCNALITNMQARYNDCPKCFVKELEQELILKENEENRKSKAKIFRII